MFSYPNENKLDNVSIQYWYPEHFGSAHYAIYIVVKLFTEVFSIVFADIKGLAIAICNLPLSDKA
jgi:hypothetical protein